MELLGTHKHPVDLTSPVGLGAVPYNKNGSLDVFAKQSQEGGHPRGSNVFPGMEGKVKSYPLSAGRDRKGGDCGHLAMPSAYLVQDRGLAPWRPGAPDQWGQQETAFVYEGDSGIQGPGFFLRAGQVAFIQFRMAFSSRSRASLSGFCGDHPIERSSRGRYL